MKRILLAGVAVCALQAGEAAASGYALREQSAVGQGTSFAGAGARNDDPSFLFNNPASMAGLQGFQASIVGSGIWPQSEMTSGTASRNALVGGSRISGTVGSDAGVNAFVPASYISAALADGLRIGASLTAPYGLSTKYNTDFIGRYHALTSSLRTYNLAPAISYQLLPNLAVGAALNIQYADARLSQAVDFGSVGAASRIPGFLPGSADGRGTVQGSRWGIGFQLGLQWEPITGTRIGLSYRSSVFNDLRGKASFEAPLPFSLSPTFAPSTVRAKLTTPDNVNLSVSQRIGAQLTLLASAEWTNWSRFRDLTVSFDNGRAASITEQRWRDSWFLAGGAEYQLMPDLALRAGVAWDQTPVPDATRTPRIADANRYWLSVGASYQVMPNVTLTAAYTHIIVDTPSLALRDTGGSTSTSFLRGNLTASYRGSVDIMAVQARFAF